MSKIVYVEEITEDHLDMLSDWNDDLKAQGIFMDDIALIDEETTHSYVTVNGLNFRIIDVVLATIESLYSYNLEKP